MPDREYHRMKYCYLNGNIVAQAEASLGITDLTLLRGYGVFDYFVFERGQARFLEEYLDRFFNSIAHLQLTSPVSKEELREAVHQLIEANQRKDGGIKLVLTGGYSEDGFKPTLGNIFILQSPFPVPPAEHFVKGATVATYQHQREFPEAKSLSYLTGIKLLNWLDNQKAHYPLYHDGIYLRESDRSNFFLIGTEGQLITPGTRVLPGITRAKVIELAKSYDITVELREVAIKELATAQEAFLTSSIKGVLPVTVIDGQQVGDGRPGPVCKRLHEGYLSMARELQYQ